MVDSIYNAALETLLNEMQTKFPAEAGALFVPNRLGFESFGFFPNNSNLVLDDTTFLSNQSNANGVIPIGIHNRDSLTRSDFETPGLETILAPMQISKDSIRTMADFRVAAGSKYFSGIIINPLDVNDGFTTRRPMDFNETAYDRIRTFLSPHQAEISRLAAIDSQEVVETMSRVFGSRIGFIENPVLPGYESISFLQQAKGRLGGDLVYSHHNKDNGMVECGNGDVAGHDESAHGLSHDIVSGLKMLAYVPCSPGEKLGLANRFVLENREYEADGGRFVIMTLARFKPEGHFDYSSAGDASYILRSDGSVDELKVGGVPLGIIPFEYPTVSCQLNPGDWYANLSDGFKEAGANSGGDNVNCFGEQRVFESLRKGTSLKNGIEILCNDAHTHANRKGKLIGDDLSITLVRYN